MTPGFPKNCLCPTVKSINYNAQWKKQIYKHPDFTKLEKECNSHFDKWLKLPYGYLYSEGKCESLLGHLRANSVNNKIALQMCILLGEIKWLTLQKTIARTCNVAIFWSFKIDEGSLRTEKITYLYFSF